MKGMKKMEILKINDENFDEKVLKSEKPVLIDFYADWCMPCKMMHPILQEISEELEGQVVVGKINVDENTDLAVKYGVMSIPTLVMIKNGNDTERKIGVQSKEELVEWIKD